MTNPNLDVDACFDEVFANIAEISGLSGRKASAKRQILTVTSTHFTTSGFLQANATHPNDSRAYVHLSGTPSPSSDVVDGIVHFVKREELRTPVYDAGKKRIQLWIDLVFLDLTLEQLKHRQLFLWIGFFGPDHTYGDLHSVP